MGLMSFFFEEFRRGTPPNALELKLTSYIMIVTK
jgi:hypothetical protein